MKSNKSVFQTSLGKSQVLSLNLFSVDSETNSELQLHHIPRKGIFDSKKKKKKRLNLVEYHFMKINMYVPPDREWSFGVSSRKITIPY